MVALISETAKFLYVDHRKQNSFSSGSEMSFISLASKEPRGDLGHYELQKLSRKRAAVSGSSVVLSSILIAGYEKLHRCNCIGQDLTWRKTSQIHPQCGNANWRKEGEVGNEQFYRNGNSHRYLQQIPQTDVWIGACFSPLLDQQSGSSTPTNLISVLKGR